MKMPINFKGLVFCLLLIFFSPDLYALNDSKKIILQIKSYLNSIKKLKADFIQVAPDGGVRQGKLYLDLPGKIRLEYINPDDLLITSQGFWLVLQDRKLKYTNNIPLRETPLKFFLNKKLSFDKKYLNIIIKRELGLILLKIKDLKKYHKSTLIMEFSENPIVLKKWVISDEFDKKTSVLLQNLNILENISHLLFFPAEFQSEEN